MKNIDLFCSYISFLCLKLWNTLQNAGYNIHTELNCVLLPFPCSVSVLCAYHETVFGLTSSFKNQLTRELQEDKLMSNILQNNSDSYMNRCKLQEQYIYILFNRHIFLCFNCQTSNCNYQKHIFPCAVHTSTLIVKQKSKY